MPENNTLYQERLLTLRAEIKKQGLSGFILPRTDEFQNEFLASYAERLAWLTGFTGSAGTAIILEDKAAVFSDGRYMIQLKNQINKNLYSIENIVETKIGEWISNHAAPESKIGYDVWLYTPKQLDAIQEKIEDQSIQLVPVESNPIDYLWHDQPARPKKPVTIFPDDIAGQSAQEKRNKIATQIKEKNCTACLLTVCDSICWLLNLRGSDIEYSPLMLSYAIVYADGSLDWFIDREKLSDDVTGALGSNVYIFPFDKIEERINRLKGQRVWLDRNTSPVWFEQTFKQANIEIIDAEDPCILPKSIKSASEQDAIRTAHIYDGVALVKFLKWIEEEHDKGALTELSVEEKLEGFRKENNTYLGPSFATIAGFAGNGAIIHYRATSETSKVIHGNGLLLVDSGGQYQWGTTDITRTIAIGTPSQEMKENYTRVLKGHIALAQARFPKGTLSKEIDALARKPLQDAGLDYVHGTGHGVGCYLCVHEAAASISPRGEQALEAGMLLSNEPGYYKEGEYGIRIENLVLVQECQDSDMLCFETVTLAPFDPELIVDEMLEEDELKWLKDYAESINKKLAPFLSKSKLEWLGTACLPFS